MKQSILLEREEVKRLKSGDTLSINLPNGQTVYIGFERSIKRERTFSSTESKPVVCPFCMRDYKNKLTLSSHFYIKHRGKTRYSCKKCKNHRKFYLKKDCELHMETFHKRKN